MAIQIRRGNENDLKTAQLVPGELAAATDTHKLLCCFTDGSAEQIYPIVESGTSGIWTYQKYLDGTAECWTVLDPITIKSIATAWNGMFYTEVCGGANYPTGLFVEEPCCTIGCHTENFPGWIKEVSKSNNTAMSPGLWACTAAAFTSSTGAVFHPSYHAVGRWKE